MNGLPLLSHPPPDNSDGSEETACRKCNKEFNFIFARQKRCNHCGYAYCSSCADFQALMPRLGPETGYEPLPVCAFCMDLLTVTASSKGKLRSLPLSKLRAYMNAYNIQTGGGALEKDDLVEAMIRARGTNGCLLPVHEEYYRHNSVPRKVGERQRTRSFFSRPPRQSSPPPVSSSSQRQYAPPPGPPPPHVRAGPPRPVRESRPAPSPPRAFPQPPLHGHNPPHPHHYMPPQSHTQYPPAPAARPAPSAFRPSASQTNFHNHPPFPPSGANRPSQPPQPPPRPRSAAPTVPTTRPAPAPVPSLDSLLDKNSDEISHLSISTLKAVLFQNRVNSSTGVLEKEDLVRKVLALVNDEKKDREIAEREEREEAERMEWARKERERLEEERKAEERERKLMEERLRQDTNTEGSKQGPTDESKSAPPPAPPSAPYSERPQDGLCVICCDAHANMAIIDCGHLALCKACSEIVMKTSRECPLCRTRIVTEQRLLRIFKS